MDVVGLESGIGVAQRGVAADFDFGESRCFGVCSCDGVGIDSEIGGGGLGDERGNSSESSEGVMHVQHCSGVEGEDVVEQYRMVLQGKVLATGVGEELVLSRLEALALNVVSEDLLTIAEVVVDTGGYAPVVVDVGGVGDEVVLSVGGLRGGAGGLGVVGEDLSGDGIDRGQDVAGVGGADVLTGTAGVRRGAEGI